MGYRSDVRILVSKKGYDKLYKYVQNETEKNKLDYNLLENPGFRTVTKNGVYIGWDWIKWYEWSNYKPVDIIMDGLNYIKQEDYSYSYARMGESYDDYEEYNYASQAREDDLPYIETIRKFDDDYMKEGLRDKPINKEVSDEILL